MVLSTEHRFQTISAVAKIRVSRWAYCVPWETDTRLVNVQCPLPRHAARRMRCLRIRRALRECDECDDCVRFLSWPCCYVAIWCDRYDKVQTVLFFIAFIELTSVVGYGVICKSANMQFLYFVLSDLLLQWFFCPIIGLRSNAIFLHTQK